MNRDKKRIAVLGAGIAGLATAIDLAANGHHVIVFEKNSTEGGRGRSFTQDGFRFDMGPSWYWMPDIFEAFFNKHNKSASDYFKLVRLDPSYRIFFKNQILDAPAEIEETYKLFEKTETGSSNFLKAFLADAKIKYEVGMKDFVRKPALKISEYLDFSIFKNIFKLQLFKSIDKIIDKGIQDNNLRSWLKFPALFLGAKPVDTPGLYSLMNYADLVLGSWYPMGGMEQLFKAMKSLALEKMVDFHFNEEVKSIEILDGKAQTIKTDQSTYEIDYVVSTIDYHHTESSLLSPEYRQYSEEYWNKRVLAPSALIFYLGIRGKIDGLLHHNLFFDENFEDHALYIYDKKQWPEKPLFYVCVPSKTDNTVAPNDCENLFVLIPISSGLVDSNSERDKLFETVMNRIEFKLNLSLSNRIIYKSSYCIDDFKKDYYSYKGNAYGLSNILSQTGPLKPRIKHKKISNLYYAGQLTHPGPGLPPSLISGEIVASLINKEITT
ncbi:MAG: phytoene desaturase family protein [Saprospiraceae bacterium]